MNSNPPDREEPRLLRAFREYARGHIDARMILGKNRLTAIPIAWECFKDEWNRD